MRKSILKDYVRGIYKFAKRGDAREESYYPEVVKLIKRCADEMGKKDVDVTMLPKKTEAGNPDFRIWDGNQHIIGYIEAKTLDKDLDKIEDSEQLKRYRETFPNVILTNFFEFRLYRNGDLIDKVSIGRPYVIYELNEIPPLENEEKFFDLIQRFLGFTLPKSYNAETLAKELARRTKFLRHEVVLEELKEERSEIDSDKKRVISFYEAFKKYLIRDLDEETFADLYSQTITYGLFAARTRAGKKFNRELAFKYIPHTIGILKEVFKFISLGNVPKQMQITIDDIADVLQVADVNNILNKFYEQGRGNDPIVHFYETFLKEYDPKTREKRGVYYTPTPVVEYIVKSIHKLLKSRFDISDGLAGESVTLLDPAAGTLAFPAEAIKIAIEEYTSKYGEGSKEELIRERLLKNYHAFELMMAPYAIGHLKIGFLLKEMGYELRENERFKLYLTNTLEMEEIPNTTMPIVSSLSRESHMALKIKKYDPILVIMGNPPYSGISSNNNEWTETLLKTDIDGAQSYYTVDGVSLGEKNPKWLQDDYVKFLRFAQWKIQKAGKGIVGMITNHSYIDNPTFRGMRQSLMKTFNEIYILDLHGNSKKREKSPDGSKDENVFGIQQGVAIALFVKEEDKSGCKVYHADLWGKREDKYKWLNSHNVENCDYKEIHPKSPFYFFIPRNTDDIQYYLKWQKITDVFPLNGVGMTTARDKFVIDIDKNALLNRIRQFKNFEGSDDELHEYFQIRKKKGWDIRKAWDMLQDVENLEDFVFPVLYRPFDTRWIFYHNSLVWRTVKRVIYHMIKGENLGLIATRINRQISFGYMFLTSRVIDFHVLDSARDSTSLFPLYLYPSDEKNLLDHMDENSSNKKPNISKETFDKLEKAYGQKPTPEEIFYYIYAILYSNIYREKYAEFLKVDFPRIPFTKDFETFQEMAKFGKELAELHLLKSRELDNPIAKFQGNGDGFVEKVRYDEKNRMVYINNDDHFEGVEIEVWQYYIGGYQVCDKWLKSRKGRKLSLNDVETYCKVVTAIKKTIEIQKKIDILYPRIETSLLK
jgi:type I restriction-modification system DNA methylase subunit